MPKENLPTTKQGTKDLLRDYMNLHDGLSDMIENGRLRQEHIPDDYTWLVETLARLANST